MRRIWFVVVMCTTLASAPHAQSGVTTQSKVGTSHFLPEIAWDETLAQRLKLTGHVVLYNVVFQVNGVTVRADRAVINGGEATLDGNVRLTMPQSK